MLAARPTVAVEVHPNPFVEHDEYARMTALRGWLVRRLLEEGYNVASAPRSAQGVVRLRAASDGLVVVTEGRGIRSFAVEDGPDAVLRLEVLHRALMGVEQTCNRKVRVTDEPGLAVRFIDSGSEGDDALLEAVAVVAQHAGVTLASQPGPDDTLACIERRGSLAQVGLGPATEDCGPPLLVLDLGAGTSEEHRQAARSLVETVRPPSATAPLDVEALGGPPALDLAVDPAATGESVVRSEDDGELVPMHGPPRAEMRLGVSAGVVTRGRVVDPQLQAGWRMGKLRGMGGRLSLSVIPSWTSSIRVVDTRLAVGPDAEFPVGRRGHFDIAALVGTDLHTYASGTTASGDVAFAAELPVTFALRLRRQARVSLTLNPGISGVAWEHRVGLRRDNRIVWQRTAWRIGVTVGITHGWRIE